MDILKDIFDKQQDLQLEIMRHNPHSHFYNIPEDFNGYRIFMILTAIIHESVELQRETNWKWWKKEKDLDVKKIKEETSDILHFFIQLCLEIGLTPDEILYEYKQKLEENHNRQQRGY